MCEQYCNVSTYNPLPGLYEVKVQSVKFSLYTPRRNIGNGGITPLILNLSIKWRRVISYAPRWLCSQREYRYVTHNDVSVNDGPNIRWWSRKIVILYYNIIILTIALQLPTVFSTVTCCTVCSLGAIGYII